MKTDNQPKHTHGEWRIHETGTGITRIVDKDERILATVHGLRDGKDNPARILEAEANAQIIIKAINMHDELMENLKLAVNLMSIPDHMQDDNWFEEQDKLKNFIKKAEKK